MSVRSGVLALLVALGCGPAVGVDDRADGPPAAADATTHPDSRPWPDAPPGLEYVMWAHSADQLFSIDPTTFALTILGPFDTGGDAITDLAVTPDDTIYVISQTKLYTADPTTGRATLVGPVPGTTNVGMTFLPDGTLLATDADGGVRRVDPATGQVTEIGALGDGHKTAGDLVAVADGTMYGIADAGPGCTWESNCLVTVNTTTGVATHVGAIGFGQVFGAAYANGHVYAFTNAGQLIEIDRQTGAGTEVRTYPVSFWGAGVTPLVPVVQ